MSIWEILEWGAWVVSGLIFLWMLFDLFKVGSEFDEATLLSSREGVDDLFGEQSKGN